MSSDAYARNDDKVTSHVAAATIRLTDIELLVLEIIIRGPIEGMTKDEIHAAQNGVHERDTISPRLAPLERKKLIYPIGERRARSGRMQTVYLDAQRVGIDMARGKPNSKKKADKNPATASLLSALKFIEPASRDIGQVNQTHCCLAGGWAVSFDGVLCLAQKIDTDIVCYPNTKRLIAVLSKCNDTTQITQLDNERLHIKSGKFDAYVPCIDPDLFSILPPDPAAFPIDAKLKTALEVVGKLVKENAPRMVQAAVLIRNGSCVATDGAILFEHWHGWQLPFQVIVPKLFISELAKIAKVPTHCGASQNTFTLWFEDGSFIRTQLYPEKYPDTDRVWSETKFEPRDVPPGFFDALDAVEALADDERPRVFFIDRGIRTHDGEGVGAFFEIAGLPADVCFDIDYLRLFSPHATKVDFVATAANGRAAAFFGDSFRGLLMHVHYEKTKGETQGVTKKSDMDDDIPY